MRAVALAIAALLAAVSAHAETISERPDSVALTIYRDRPADTSEITDRYAQPQGLALVVETRTIDVPDGGGRIVFRGVASGIVPQSARLEGLPAELLEQNFDYDLLSPGALLEKSIGHPVRVIRTDPSTGKVTDQTAVVRSAPDGVVLEIDGRIEALHCGGLPERLIFDAVPPGLSDRPTLSVVARTGKAGRYTVRLSYLATGFDWSADYVATIRPDGQTLDLSGWITLVNRSDASFPDAPTQVVAGRWSRVADDGTDKGPIAATAVALSCWPSGSGRGRGRMGFAEPPPAPPPPPALMVEEFVVTGSRAPRANKAMAKVADLGDYKLYSLPEPTTLAARQTKQVGLLDQEAAPFTRVYGFKVDLDDLGEPGDRRPASVLLRLQNKASDHLGLALPAGSISVREPDAGGAAVLAGEDKLDDVPVGLPFEIKLGRAPDVGVVARKTAETTGRHDRRRIALEVTIVNGKPIPILFELRQPLFGRGDKVTRENQRHTSKGLDPVWTLRLQPGERQVVSYTVEDGD